MLEIGTMPFRLYFQPSPMSYETFADLMDRTFPGAVYTGISDSIVKMEFRGRIWYSTLAFDGDYRPIFNSACEAYNTPSRQCDEYRPRWQTEGF